MKNARRRLTVGITYNLKKSAGNSDTFEEYDEPATINAIKTQIENLGFKVRLFEQNKSFLKNISSGRPDFVFNIAEGQHTTRNRESQVPCVLESLGIPYSGSDPLSLSLSQDKLFANTILRVNGIPVPEFYSASGPKDLLRLNNIFKNKKYFLVKPRWEGSSKGISCDSLARNFAKLKILCLRIFKLYRQPALIEEFIEGDEITAGVCGNDKPEILGMMKIIPRKKVKTPFIYSIEVKRDWENTVTYKPEQSIPRSVRKAVSSAAIKAFKCLELKDIARIDFRIDKDNVPRIIDVNPLPGLSPRYSDLPILLKLKGKNYPFLIKKILSESFKRNHIGRIK